MEVDYQATDWGTVVQRRALTKPPAEGGWNLFCTGFSGLDWFTPASHLPLRGNGKNAWFGWPTLPKLEELRDAWFNAEDAAAQKSIGEASELIAVVPLSSSRAASALRPEVAATEGIDRPSRAICRGIRAVARSRLLHRAGAVTPETLAEIEHALGWILGLERMAAQES